MPKQNKHTILLIEDDLAIANVYMAYLAKEPYSVTHARYGKDAMVALAKQVPDAIMLDLHLPDMDGMDILHHIQKEALATSVVVITAHGSINTAVEAMRAGAADFLIKPFDAERLKYTLRHSLERSQLTRIVETLKDDFDRNEYCGFIGSSLAMQGVYKTIDNAAPSSASVFITGESGTGKEVCAEAIHQRSNRSGKPFIAINCGAIPKDLIESEIFGHVKGAFTGAVTDRDGAAQQADGGTLFLDEICEMDLALQVKFLRFIQTGTFQKVGAAHSQTVDVRFVCATNRNPWAEVTAGNFREDLYYRLHVIPVHMPPLRDRDDDVLELAEYFLVQYAKEEGKKFKGFSDDAKDAVSMGIWPGNVRQLQNAIRNGVVLNDGDQFTAEMFPPMNQESVGPTASVVFPTTEEPDTVTLANLTQMAESDIVPMHEMEMRHIQQAIDACGGNISKAAGLLEIGTSTIYRRLKEQEEQNP